MNYRIITGVVVMVTLGLIGSSQAFNTVSVTNNGKKVKQTVDVDKGGVSIVNGNTSVEISDDEITINATSGNAVNVDSQVVITSGQKESDVIYEEVDEPTEDIEEIEEIEENEVEEVNGEENTDDGFPRDVAQYPGSQVEQNIGNNGNYVITLQSKDVPEKIHQFYKKQMLDSGWKSTLMNKSDDSYQMMYKKTNATAQIKIEKEDNYTEINIITSLSH